MICRGRRLCRPARPKPGARASRPPPLFGVRRLAAPFDPTDSPAQLGVRRLAAAFVRRGLTRRLPVRGSLAPVTGRRDRAAPLLVGAGVSAGPSPEGCPSPPPATASISSRVRNNPRSERFRILTGFTVHLGEVGSRGHGKVPGRA